MSANRSGILAQVAPNLGPMFWQQLNGSDGVVRHIQWQARIEGRTKSTGLHSLVHVDTNIVAASMTITQYLGMGTTSRGRMGITPSLNTRVMTPPYLRDQHDKEAVVQGIEYIRGILTTAFVNSVSQLFSVVMTCCKSNDSLNRYPRHLVPEVRTTGPGLAR
jgi:cellobiose dehydrogenase (acceptor)